MAKMIKPTVLCRGCDNLKKREDGKRAKWVCVANRQPVVCRISGKPETV